MQAGKGNYTRILENGGFQIIREGKVVVNKLVE